jgi:hypothetical protein
MNGNYTVKLGDEIEEGYFIRGDFKVNRVKPNQSKVIVAHGRYQSCRD